MQQSCLKDVIPAAVETWPDEAACRRERREILAAALSGLGARQRVVVALRFGEDLTLREIAGRVGATEPGVHGLLRRAMAGLRAALAARGVRRLTDL